MAGKKGAISLQLLSGHRRHRRDSRKNRLSREGSAVIPSAMKTVTFSLRIPADLGRFELPQGEAVPLQSLLDRQDQGVALTKAERREAEGLVDLAESLTLLKLRATRAGVTFRA